MLRLNTDTIQLEYDMTSEVQIAIDNGDVTYWQNTTGRDVKIRMTAEMTGKPTYSFAENGQLITMRFYIGPANTLASANLLTLATVKWTQEDVDNPYFNPDLSGVVIENDAYFFVTVESSDAADDEIRMFPVKIWEDVDNITVSTNGNPNVNAAECSN